MEKACNLFRCRKVLDMRATSLFPVWRWRGGGNAYVPGVAILTCFTITGGVLDEATTAPNVSCAETERQVPGSLYMNKDMKMTKQIEHMRSATFVGVSI